MMTTRLTISHAEGEYPIYIGSDLLQRYEIFEPHIQGRQVFIVTNASVADLYLEQLCHTLSQHQCDTLVLPDGETHKNLSTFEKIIDALVEKNHHRDTTMIALGGGVVGDMTGFAAACYLRGVNVIQVPTTLLSQVDSSIGGKTAVNHPKAKNFIGAFYHPECVVIDIDTLMTLPEREFLAGFAEIIKAALIKDQDFVGWLDENHAAIFARDKNILSIMISRACDIKRQVVEQDAKETGDRALLNFGHTFGHAIEQNLGYGEWLHGEAVALGMLMAGDLSHRLGMITSEQWQQVQQLINRYPYPTRLPAQLSAETMLETMWTDKKVCNNALRLILLEDVGRAVISTKATDADILAVIKTYQS